MEQIFVALGRVLYSARFLMIGFYFGLALLILVLLGRFASEMITLLASQLLGRPLAKADLVVKTLELVDMVMIGQLVWVVALAGYSLFVSSAHFDNTATEKPDWLDHVNTYNLKLKLAFAMIAISGVHALKTYLQEQSDTRVLVTAGVHLIFVVSAVGIAYAERATRSQGTSRDH